MPWIPRNSIFMGEPNGLAVHGRTILKAVRAENMQVFKNDMSICGKATTGKWLYANWNTFFPRHKSIYFPTETLYFHNDKKLKPLLLQCL